MSFLQEYRLSSSMVSLILSVEARSTLSRWAILCKPNSRRLIQLHRNRPWSVCSLPQRFHFIWIITRQKRETRKILGHNRFSIETSLAISACNSKRSSAVLGSYHPFPISFLLFFSSLSSLFSLFLFSTRPRKGDYESSVRLNYFW